VFCIKTLMNATNIGSSSGFTYLFFWGGGDALLNATNIKISDYYKLVLLKIR